MWNTILNAKGKDVVKQKETAQSSTPSTPRNVVYVMALEGNKPNPEWTFWQKALDSLVQVAQPAPSMSHIELLIPPTVGNDNEEFHFATYMGKESGYGSSFGDGMTFYLDPNGNGNSWRAVPIYAVDAVPRMRSVCNQNAHTPYGSPYRLFDYPFSVPPLRNLAWTLQSKHPAPAHCANLVARCCMQAIPELELPSPAAWYGPSTLYLELTRHARMTSYANLLREQAVLRSITEDEEALRAADTLLRGSDESVVALTDAECRVGVEMLTRQAVAAAVSGDVTAQRTKERNLARALLRWSQINVATRLAPPPPPQPPAPKPPDPLQEEQPLKQPQPAEPVVEGVVVGAVEAQSPKRHHHHHRHRHDHHGHHGRHGHHRRERRSDTSSSYSGSSSSESD